MMEKLAYIGSMGMLLTGWWAWQNDVIWTVSALATAPYVISLVFGRCAHNGGGVK